MRLTVSEARACLGQLCTRAQDPREVIVLTRHGRDVAGLVSIPELERIWRLQDAEWGGPRSPLTGRRRGRSLILGAGLTIGRDGRLVTMREAAEQVRDIQMTRAEERRMLAAGGLEPVEGGEIGVREEAVRPGAWRRLARVIGGWVFWGRR